MIVRKKRPHSGAQLRFPDLDGRGAPWVGARAVCHFIQPAAHQGQQAYSG